MPVGAVIGGTAISGLFSMEGSRRQAQAQREGQRTQTSTVNQQIEFEREQEGIRREEEARVRAEERRQWEAQQAQDAEDRLEERRRYAEETTESRRRDDLTRGEDKARYEAKETRLQPFRKEGTAAIARLGAAAARAGIELKPVGEMTRGLPGAPGAQGFQPPPVVPPPPPQYMGQLVPPPR